MEMFPASIDDVATLVLAGGRGTRLGALTASRAKPAVPIGRGYRLIDFTLSNCLHSGVSRVGVITQYGGESLRDHLAQAWNFRGRYADHFVKRLPSKDGADEHNGYRGTADAVFQNLEFVRQHRSSHTLVLAGDHVYKMDYRALLREHLRSGADLTVGCVEVPLAEAREFGVMHVDPDGRIIAFSEKPARPEPVPGRSDVALVSMGIYIFETSSLEAMLASDAVNPSSSHDFGRDIVPAAVRATRAQAYRLPDLENPSCQGYWRDVGTIDSYFQANFDLAGRHPVMAPTDRFWPIHGAGSPSQPYCPGAADSILFPGVRIAAGSGVQRSVLLPGARVGARCLVNNAIVECGCRIPEGTSIGVDDAQDRERFQVSPGGVVVVTQESLEKMEEHRHVFVPQFWKPGTMRESGSSSSASIIADRHC